MPSSSPFTSVQVAGGLLPPDLLGKVLANTDLPGTAPQDYHLVPGEGLRQAASRAWDYLTGVWSAYRRELDTLGNNAPTTGITRERWLLILLRELGFGRVPSTPSGGVVLGEAEQDAFPISHRWEAVPIHLLGWNIALDQRTKGVAGAAGAAPQSMVQELLNRTDAYLWAILSNGQRLRLLRDSTSLVGSAYVEFDLEAIFDGELFSDFVLLYLLAHQSRFETAEGAGPASCWLEQWRTVAAEQGTRALEHLRDGVELALTTLGTGFLQHPDNHTLREGLSSGSVGREDYHRALLRVVYRLLFWMITEDRDALLDPYAHGKARERYAQYYSAAHLRELSRTRRGDRHADLWQSVRLVFDGLGHEGGRPELGLPGLGGLFDPTSADRPLDGAATGGAAAADRAQLPNEALLGAIRALTIIQDTSGGPRRRVDFRNLGADELGSVYESLLELHPSIDTAKRSFGLQNAAGNERKLTGSYYTPSSLIQSLLDTALNPLLDEAMRADDPVEALLNLTVCDPACGSGHFLVAAARRIAKRLASVETGEAEPAPTAMQAALRRVVGRCIHGVDANPMAAELAKVALWLEALEPGKPLSFLDANIRVGNSLLGVTPKLLADGIPNEAFKALEGDDKKVAQGLAKINKEQRKGQGDLFADDVVDTANAALARATANLLTTSPDSLTDVHTQQTRFADIEAQRERKALAADTWCAAFVQPKTRDTQADAITQNTLLQADTDRGLPQPVADRVRSLAGKYGFFHWHLEFPHIFQVASGVADDGDVNPDTGWTGGFTCVLGNPPWDRVKLQEQEFFAPRDEDIAKAPNAAKRKKLIEKLADSEEPAERALYGEFVTAKNRAEASSHFLHTSGRYPLTGRGDINTYQVFAESDRTIISPRGRTGVVLPTGIATDATTQYFFKDLVTTRTLASLYDFENEEKIFPAVHHSYRFCLWTGAGVDATQTKINLAFRLRQANQIHDRQFTLTPEDIKLLNPNTGTCPVFDYKRNAEITLSIYRHVQTVLWQDDPEHNPWGISFMSMFHMSNDSHLFYTREDLEAAGWMLEGNIFVRGDSRMVPLYEAKMVHHFDHRYGTYARQTQAQANVGTVPRPTPEQKDNPRYNVLSRYWVAEKEVTERLARKKWTRGWFLGWRDICRSSDARTAIFGVVPYSAVGGTLTVALPSQDGAALCANLSSFALDYVARQKIAGTHLNQLYLKQLPIFPPETYDRDCPWKSGTTLSDWVNDRVLELSCTGYDILEFSHDHGRDGPPFRWDETRRFWLRADLDAAYFHLYGVTRCDVDYIMDSFRAFQNNDPERFTRTKQAILDTYDAMAKAIERGHSYETRLDPPPGQGPRHTDHEHSARQ